MVHRLTHTLQPVEHADGRQHVGGIAALAAPRFEQLALHRVRQQSVEQLVLDASLHKAGAKVAQDRIMEGLIRQLQAQAELVQDRVVEALVRQLQAQEVLPVNAAAHRLRRPVVGQTTELLQDLVERSPQAAQYYSDAFSPYHTLVYHPGHHAVAPGKSQTYSVEADNAEVRHYLARLARNSRCFSRSIAALRWAAARAALCGGRRALRLRGHEQHVPERLRVLHDRVLSDALARRQISAPVARETKTRPDEMAEKRRQCVPEGARLQHKDLAGGGPRRPGRRRPGRDPRLT
jgi:IS1 family transposase